MAGRADDAAPAHRGQGTGRGASGARGDAASLLSIDEAAVLARVAPEEISTRIASGELLFESKKRGRTDVKLIRVYDLADLYPHVLGRDRSAGPAGPADGPSVGPPSDSAEDPPTGATTGVSEWSEGAPVDELVEAVRSSGASRDAVIALAQDLEARLDLAERERQASTASLLMAQRRILDLELELRRGPWRRASGAVVGLVSLAALVAALSVPRLVREATRTEARALEEKLATTVTASLEAEARQLEGRLLAEQSRASEEWQRQSEQATTELREQWSAELASGLGDGAARTAELGARVETALDAFGESLRDARRVADEAAARKAAETLAAVQASDRDRDRFTSRLAEAERLASDIRAALASERRASAEDRARFDEALQRLKRDAAEDDLRHSAELNALRASIDTLVEARRKADAEAASVNRNDPAQGANAAGASRGLVQAFLGWLRGA